MSTAYIRNELIRVIKKVLRGKASAKEKSFLEKYYQYFDKEELISNSLSSEEKEYLENKILLKIVRLSNKKSEEFFLKVVTS